MPLEIAKQLLNGLAYKNLKKNKKNVYIEKNRFDILM